MVISLAQFEKIDGLSGQLIRMGDFEACADPRGYIRLSNQLFDACLDAGMPFDTADHELWALETITNSLVEA